MMDIFQDFLRHFLEVFIDDFAVFRKRWNHLEFLKSTFERCRETNLKLHPSKCFLGMESGILLRHVVSKSGLEVDMDKVKVILALSAPRNVREIRGFLRCVGYYQWFIENYARKGPEFCLEKKEKKQVRILGTQDPAGFGTTASNRRTGPGWCQFQRINNRTSLPLLTFVQIAFSHFQSTQALEIYCSLPGR